MRSTKKDRGRPQIPIDNAQVERLAAIQCTDEEIAAVLGVSVDTLSRRKKDDPEFLDFLQRGKAKGRATLRRLQWQRANGGSDTMLLWLGKQLLGQRDKNDIELAGPGGGAVTFRWADSPVASPVDAEPGGGPGADA